VSYTIILGHTLHKQSNVRCNVVAPLQHLAQGFDTIIRLGSYIPLCFLKL